MNHLARHDGEILDACRMLEAKLDEEDEICIRDVVVAVRPRAHPVAAAGLVRVLAAGVEFAVAVPRDVEVVVGELGALVVEALAVGEEFLEGRGVYLVADGVAVDGVADRGVLDLEDAVVVEV